MIRYGSVCSGIEAATRAWHPLGWSPAFFAEIEKFPSAVLAHHYGSNMPGEPLATNGVPNLGDMTQFEGWPDYAIDLLVGGTPCQDYSVAGLRTGMDGVRGSLTLTYAAIARRYRPRWLAWENVPGVLSSKRGRDFAGFLGLLSGRRIEVPRDGWRTAGIIPGYNGAYGLAWRVLDAQYVRVDGFGRAVPQRRRRVFVVGYTGGDWRRAAAVLFEREGLRGDSPPRREAAQSVAGTIDGGAHPGGYNGQDAYNNRLIAEIAFGGGSCGAIEVAAPLNACPGPTGRLAFENETFVAHALRGEGFDGSEDGSGRGTPIVPVVVRTLTRGAESRGKGGYAGRRQEDDDNLVAFPLTAGMAASAHRRPQEQGALVPVAYALRSDAARSGEAKTASIDGNGRLRKRDAGFNVCAGFAPTLETSGVPTVSHDWAVRRLTPRECERLQGFPDDFTNVPWRGKPNAADGPRYKAIGNSMAVNVMRWIGRRIEMVEQLGQGGTA